MHIRLVNVYLLNVPSVSSLYFNKITRTSHLGKWHALSLEILFARFFIFANSFKRHICGNKNSRLRHDSTISVNDKVIMPLCDDFIFTKFREY